MSQNYCKTYVQANACILNKCIILVFITDFSQPLMYLMHREKTVTRDHRRKPEG
jgi:hypothetical protein